MSPFIQQLHKNCLDQELKEKNKKVVAGVNAEFLVLDPKCSVWFHLTPRFGGSWGTNSG